MLSHHEVSPLLDSEHRSKQNERCPRRAPCAKSSRTSFIPVCRLSSVLSLLFVLLCSTLLGTASAETHGDQPSLLVANVEDDLAWKGSSLFIDHRPPPLPPLLMPPIHEHDKESTSDAPSLVQRAIATDPKNGTSDFTIPQPLDTGLSNNFTSTCASFLNRLRTNDAFNKCHPFSLMLLVCGITTMQKSNTDLCRHLAGFSMRPNRIFESHKLWTLPAT